MVKAAVLSLTWFFIFAFAVVGSTTLFGPREHNWIVDLWLIVTLAIFLGVYLTEKGV